MKIPEYLKDATNVYRTKKYIVRQIIRFEYDAREGANFCSYDTLYLRNEKRDADYEMTFKARRHMDGKRLRTGLCTSNYVK